jgi:hypothetical protein
MIARRFAAAELVRLGGMKDSVATSRKASARQDQARQARSSRQVRHRCQCRGTTNLGVFQGHAAAGHWGTVSRRPHSNAHGAPT